VTRPEVTGRRMGVSKKNSKAEAAEAAEHDRLKATSVKQTRRYAPRPNRLPSAGKLQGARDVLPINPDFFYRKIEGWKFFGYAATQLEEKIKAGVIPTPVALDDGGRACGWFGRTILEWQASRVAKPAKAIREAVAS
jgi:predicted DNA-binding transcriptional regulator AlpA